MGNIRRQSIISSVVIYIGFAIGILNIYLFTRQGLSPDDHFTDAQFGLYNAFIAIATTMMAFANLAMPSYIYKFFPYYKDHLPPKKNDLITWALVVSSIGYLQEFFLKILLSGNTLNIHPRSSFIITGSLFLVMA